MYMLLIFTHSWLRWVILALLVTAIVVSLVKFLRNSPISRMDNILGFFLIMSTHLQFVLGICLYLISPLIQMAFQSGMMMQKVYRYWAIEHVVIMFLAILSVQIGRTLGKKAKNAQTTFKFNLIFYSLGLFLMAAGIPWPWREIGRQLFLLF